MAAKKRGVKKAPAKCAKPTPKNRVSKAARRVAIVEGLVQQRTPKQIAGELRISRKTLYEELKAPETQQLIQRWLQPYHDEVQALIPAAIAAVRETLSPVYAVGETLVPADPAIRIRSVKALGVILAWAQGKTDGADPNTPIRRFSGTMEELLIEYKTLTRGESQGKAAEAV
jgi:hypothetical protein